LKPGVVTHAVREARRVLVALVVERGDDLLGELGAFLEHRSGGVQTVVGVRRHAGGQAVEVGELGDVEQHVLDRGGVRHGELQKQKRGTAVPLVTGRFRGC
jgi:hypothetical protein